MKIKSIFLILSICFGIAQALTIQTTKALDLNKSKGILVGEVIVNNKIQKAKAIGNYKLSSNRKSVLFTIEKIFKDDQIYKLASNPTAIKQLKNKNIPKGSKIILAGENEEEIAQIFGMNAKEYQKAKNSSSNPTQQSNSNSNVSTPNFSSSASTGTSSSYYPTTSSNSGTSYYPVGGDSSDSNSSDSSSSNNNYTSQYCKSPSREGNEISLSIVDKNGNCYDLIATRDDTQCTYRYDFNNGVAIKQTQFYYVDKENETQKIGSCVDLEGDQYQYQLYADDTKCKLQITDGKLYGGGVAYIFQTQILFRGADGTIQVAKDCTDYANVKEDLINYDVDLASGTLKRVVNQYYIDPITGEKIIINNGVNSPYEFNLKEYQCGDWEYNDSALEAYKKTQIRAYDEISGAYYDATGCDYTTDGGKSGKITQKYTKIIEKNIDGEQEEGDMNGEYTFEIKERVLNSSTNRASFYCDCFLCDATWRYTNYTSYSNGNLIAKAKWKTTYKTRNIGNTIGYQRPKQDNEEKATIYYVSKAIKKIERTPIIEQNEINLDENYLKFYEANEGYYKDESVRTSQEFNDWLSKYYKKGKGSFCQIYSIWNTTLSNCGDKYNTSYATAYNAGVACQTYNDYIKP